MKPDDFEQRLQDQPLRQVPREWRADILASVCEGQTRRPSPVARRPAWLSTLSQQLSALLWPHPKAWAGLAAVWVLIVLANFSMRDTSPVLAEKDSPPSPEVIVQLKKQQRMFAELVGSYEPKDADRRKSVSPKPRSERMEDFRVA